MAEFLYKALVVLAWSGALGWALVAWLLSGIGKAIEDTFNRRSQGDAA